MSIPNSAPIGFTATGLSDVYDSTRAFPGACRKLVNLIFDQANPEVILPRPGVQLATAFASFTTPGYVSVQVVIGTRIYGMLATGLTAGYDEPFCVDYTTGSFVAISGLTAGNAEGRPASPATTGAWTPPTMAVVGVKIIITHPGYTGVGSNFFGVIDITNPAAPAYSTTNTATNVLPGVPTAVANFNNRAYFAYQNQVWYSDVLVPTTMTNAGQSLTLGDSTYVTALAGLPIQTSTGGIVGSLMCFKGSQIWQVTGDAAVTGSLALNYVSLTVGTQAPRSVVPTPIGTVFAGADSVYVLSSLGAVAPLTTQMGAFGAQPDISQPFIYMTTPTRTSAAFTANTYRICMDTTFNEVAGTYDFWFDFRKMRWNGPHTFTYDCASGAGALFYVTTPSATGIFLSPAYVTIPATSYLDNSVAYSCEMLSATFPKHGEMAEKQVIESTVELASNGATYAITTYDASGNIIQSANVASNSAGSLWGAFVWGDGTRWASGNNRVKTYQIDWADTLVFNKMAIDVTFTAAANGAVGTFFFRTQKTGYLLQT